MATRTDNLQILLTPAEKADLFELARQDGRTAGGLIRHLIDQYKNQQLKAA